MVRRRNVFKIVALLNFTPLLLLVCGLGVSFGSQQLDQTPLVPTSINKYVDPLPVFGPANPDKHFQRVDKKNITVKIQEFEQQVLSSDFVPYDTINYDGKTWVWGYKVGNGPALYPGVTIESMRNQPTDVTYMNELPSASEGGFVQKLLTVDQTIHWADPTDKMCAMELEYGTLNCEETPDDPCCVPYTGPVPTVVHLHGAEVQSLYDGGPEQWWTPANTTAPYERFGPTYYTYSGSKNKSTSLNTVQTPGKAVYHYPNGQEATTLWFHDHSLGITRLNVYSGMAAFYLLRDDRDTGTENNPIGLPGGPYELEVLVQDRQFDTNGQLYFPDGSGPGLNGPPPNPAIHPFWNPEFLGDVMVVNGKTWPYLNVEPRRYRLRFLNGCNARFLNMYWRESENSDTAADGPTFWQIGTDGGLLDDPVSVGALLLAPAERADTIVDFSGFAGQTLYLGNNANAPFPDGDPVDPDSNGQIMKIIVGPADSVVDNTCDPASGGCTLRQNPIVALEAPTDAVDRQLTLNESMGAGGPLIVMVNNSRWNGKEGMIGDPIPGSTNLYGDTWATEMPQVGTTEVWEFINTTGDAHPIHLHLVQFQVLNRQAFDADGYYAAYEAAFDGGSYVAGFGPPNDYLIANTDGAIGGNPAVGTYLIGNIYPPDENEMGWKDTAKAPPGMVTRYLVRFAPQDVAVGDVDPGQNLYPFDPTIGPGYVWHCHIIDHEDNEMMRPYGLQYGPVPIVSP